MFNPYEMEWEIERQKARARERGDAAHLRLPEQPGLLRRLLAGLMSRRRPRPALREKPGQKRVARLGH